MLRCVAVAWAKQERHDRAGASHAALHSERGNLLLQLRFGLVEVLVLDIETIARRAKLLIQCPQLLAGSFKLFMREAT
ncbi:MAG: hypothetical protein ACJ8AW_51150 [Rhodopila sp.]